MDNSIKIIENGYVFTGNKQNHAGRLTVLVRNGRIAEIGKSTQILKSLYPDAEVVDASGKVLLPGFVDAHHTGDSFLLRYVTSGQPMSKWSKTPAINHAFEYLKKEATFEEFLTLYRLSYYAAIKSGITTLSEFGIDTPEYSFSAALETMKLASLRGYIGLHNSDQIEAAKRVHETSVRFAYVIEDEEKITTYDLQNAIRLAQELQWPIILHLGQTQKSFDHVKKNFNKSIAQLCQEYRIFDYPVHLVHLACFDEGDFDIIAKPGASLVVSPSAILQKSTDMPPFEELIRRKITIALGTDWGPVQPVENLRAYGSILKSLGLSAGKAYNLLALHTMNSAHVLNLDKEIGSIETGKRGNIVFFDMSEFRMSTILADERAERILEIVLQEANTQQISDVMINGEFYVREGQLLTYSEDDLASEAQALFKKLIKITEKKSAPAQSAAVLPFSEKKNDRKITLRNEITAEEGFKIITRDPEASDSEETKDSSLRISKLPDNVRRVFGDDEV